MCSARLFRSYLFIACLFRFLLSIIAFFPQEIEGASDIAAFFTGTFPHGKVVLPFVDFSPADEDCLTMDDDDEVEEVKTPSSPPGTVLAPFVEFTTLRRRWVLDLNGTVFNVDVDEASFGCCIAEFELMVSGSLSVCCCVGRIPALSY